MPEAVPQHQRLLNLATATINTSEQRNPIFATPSIRQLSGNISCSFICRMVGMRMSRLLSMFWLLVGADPSSAKSKPVLTQRLAQPHSEVCQSLQGLASSSMNLISRRTCSSRIVCASARGSLPGNGPPPKWEAHHTGRMETTLQAQNLRRGSLEEGAPDQSESKTATLPTRRNVAVEDFWA